MLVTAAVLYLALMALRRAPAWWLSLPFAVREPTAPLATGIGAACLALGEVPAGLLFLAGVLLGLRRRRRRGALPELRGRMLHVATLNAGMHRADPERVLRWIAECGADVIALQEVGEDLAPRLEAGEHGYPHDALHGAGIDGLALLSRLPIQGSSVLGAPLHHQVVDLDWAGDPVRVLNVHPYFHVAWLGLRAPAARDLPRLVELATEGAPALVLGDLNAPPQTRIHDAFTEFGLADAFEAVGRGAGRTFPVPLRYLWLPLPPLLRLDHILHTDHWEPLRCQVGRDASSDHLPLVGALRLRRRPQRGAAKVTSR